MRSITSGAIDNHYNNVTLYLRHIVVKKHYLKKETKLPYKKEVSIMELAKFIKNSWDGHERRKMPRRSEDLVKCISCGVYFSWEASSPICSACGSKLMVLYQPKGNILNTFV